MTDNTQPEALRLADELEDEFTQWRISNHTGRKATTELRRQHARIAELEAQLESIGAGARSEPIAWLVCTEEGDPDMVFLSQHEAQQYLEDDERPTPLYTHPSPPEGMVGGWVSVDERLPKCSRKPDSLGVEVLIWPPHEDGSRTAFYGRRQSQNPNFYKYGALLGHVGFWQYPPAPPATSAGSGKGE